MPEACPLCRSSTTGLKYALTGYRIAVCPSCGFWFNDGFSGGGGDDEMFGEDYYRVRHREAFQRQFEDGSADPSAPVYERWLKRIEAWTPAGRILDVGSALGTFLKIAQQRGWRPQGVEISKFAADFCKRRHGIDVFNGDLQDFEAAPESFDAVTFWDSIEHVGRPRENLEKAAELLRGGGLMLLTTDNFDCLIADVARFAHRASLGKFRYPMERVFIDRNRSFFTVETLTKLLAISGMEVVELEKMEYPLDKIKTSPMERLILRAFYGLGAFLGRQAQVTVVARKRQPPQTAGRSL